MARSGPAKWLPIAIPVALIVVLLPVAVAIGLRNGDDNSTSDNTEPTTSSATPITGAIDVHNFAFEPKEMTANVGMSLTFHNTSTTEHAIKVGDDDPGKLEPGATWDWLASETGTFDVVCTIHPNEMTGMITVS